MPLTGRLTDVCDYLFDLIEMNSDVLGVEDVFYGDQDKLPRTPAVCVEPDEKLRDMYQAQRQTVLTHRVYIMIYHGAVISPQSNRRAADKLAEDIEELIHSKTTLEGLVIHGHCSNISSGYIPKQRTLMRASRITYEATSRQLLPSTG